MCRFDMAPGRTNNVRGEKTIRIKTTRTEKKGFTVALAAAADETKLPATIIFKERGGGGLLGKEFDGPFVFHLTYGCRTLPMVG